MPLNSLPEPDSDIGCGDTGSSWVSSGFVGLDSAKAGWSSEDILNPAVPNANYATMDEDC